MKTLEQYQLEQEQRRQHEQSQMESYYEKLHEWESYMEQKKPKKENYGYINNMPPDQEGERAYETALSEWHMEFSCDAPNKPGYYRANND